ncbi:MAG: cytochrome c biogenesis protein ResB [Deltaproteobacteria bacterium]|nr:cytochrome c biogenesis protein ResB [Deltaproteobacteria bacterium]NCP03007.1 cytochrome c biogenesis protein ResB [Deltaproteobacteria bacterium]
MNTKKTTFVDSVWDFFCSLKLTILILLLLSVTSIIGTVIQQGGSAEEYIREYGQSNYELFTKLQFTDMYHSWWFVGLLGLFSVNLICCSIKNFPRAWKFVVSPQLIASDATFKNSANKGEFSTKESIASLLPRLNATIKSHFAKPVETKADGAVHLFAQGGIYSRFGAYMTHLSILVIMVGAMVGTVWGYKAYVNIVEGTSISQVWPRGGETPIELGFSVRCDDFDVVYYAGTQRPKTYSSELVVLDGGKEVLKKKIEVNHPLSYKGITFYQSSYGPAGTGTFELEVTDNQTGEKVQVTTAQGKKNQLARGFSFSVDDFTPNYDRFGPAARLHVDAPDGTHRTPFVIMQNFPQFDARRGGDFSFALKGYNQPQYTGLQVAKDPGVWVVWTGCFMMVFGSMGAFFFSHRRLWVRLREEKGKTLVQVAANAHRNQAAFAMRFEDLIKQIETTIENKA